MPAANRVLVLHSYHKGYRWTDAQQDALEGELVPRGVELFVEYMDTQRNFTPRTFALLAAVYRDRYAGRPEPYAAIVATDDPALDFLLEYRDELFPGTPVVFAGINNVDPARIPREAGYTGVNEAIDIPGTLDLMLELRPETSRVYVISDTSLTGEINKRIFAQERRAHDHLVDFQLLYDLEPTELYRQLSDLDPGDAVLYLSYIISPDGHHLSAEESLSTISRVSPAPVYSLWDFLSGTGAVGGMVVDGGEQGRAAAAMVLEILSGTPAADIPLLMESPNRILLEYPALVRHGISPRELPPGAQVLGRPFSPVRQYWWVLALLLAFIVGEALLILGLLASRRRRRRVQRELESITRNSPDIIVRLDAAGRHIFVNPAMERILGISPGELLGKTGEEIAVTAEAHAEWLQTVRNVLCDGITRSATYAVAGSQGKTLTLESRLVAERGDQGAVESVLVITRDTTASEEARTALAQSLREKEVLLREIHHRVKNNLQIIASLISITASDSRDDNPALTDMQNRVVAMAQIHEQLYRSGDFAAVDLGEYLRGMAHHLLYVYTADSAPVRLEFAMEEVHLELDIAVPFGQIVTEVMTNCFKHAWRAVPSGSPGVSPPILRVSLHREVCREPRGIHREDIRLEIADNGAGLPQGFDPRSCTSTGMTLVRSLAEQIRGSFTMDSREPGTVFSLHIPLPEETHHRSGTRESPGGSS